jgi:AcrR family transcriptional regulator
VFSLFATKRDLFIAAVERCFDAVTQEFTAAAERAAAAAPFDAVCVGNPVLDAIGARYVELLESDRGMVMAQLQAYAACNDEVIREHVARCYQALIARVQELAGIDDAQVNEFMGFGAYLTIQAAMGGADLVALKAARKTVLQERPGGSAER